MKSAGKGQSKTKTATVNFGKAKRYYRVRRYETDSSFKDPDMGSTPEGNPDTFWGEVAQANGKNWGD
jgi:hypothetical protein